MFFDTDEFTKRQLSKKKRGTSLHKLQSPDLELRPYVEFTDKELADLPIGWPLIYDVEAYKNYWLVSFKCPEQLKVVSFEISPDTDFDRERLRWVLFKFCCIGFYSFEYDLPMVCGAIQGFGLHTLKALSDALIGNKDLGIPGMTAREAAKEFGFKLPDRINQIDLVEVAPLEGSLKLYAARLQAPRLQDLPFDPHTLLTQDQAQVIKFYNVNDLDNTILLYKELLPQIELRERLGREYRQDVRSRSDAQIAEAVICSELAKLTGRFPPKAPEGTVRVQYSAPAWVGYASPQLRDAVNCIEAVPFLLDGNGSPMWPEGLGERDGDKAWALKVRIGNTVYKMGMGGLHSQESCAAHIADDDTLLIDRDVASFYPRIILNERLYPKHLGEAFLTVYNGLVDKRLLAKTTGDKVTADALKITINGGFGKFGNKYSRLYSPDLLLKVTITGQLALLMLIEMIEWHSISVVSGNTDGIVIKCPKSRYEELNSIIAMWEQITGFETEETRYKAIFSRDVNNYFAVKDLTDESEKDKQKRLKSRYLNERLGVKVKGAYSEVGSALNSVLSKNAENLVCSDAVLNMLTQGIPVRETIEACKDIRRFTTVRRVNGGAEKNGIFIGKVIRWYHAENCPGQIRYITNGNAVGKSEGAKPLMDLPLAFPNDIDFDYYVNEANEILYDVGFKKRPNSLTLWD